MCSFLFMLCLTEHGFPVFSRGQPPCRSSEAAFEAAHAEAWSGVIDCCVTAGPTVLEVFNTLLKHLRMSVDFELGESSRRNSACSVSSGRGKESEERIVQNAIIQTIGMLATVALRQPPFVRTKAKVHPLDSSLQASLEETFQTTSALKSWCSSWERCPCMARPATPWIRWRLGESHICFYYSGGIRNKPQWVSVTVLGFYNSMNTKTRQRTWESANINWRSTTLVDYYQNEINSSSSQWKSMFCCQIHSTNAFILLSLWGWNNQWFVLLALTH